MNLQFQDDKVQQRYSERRKQFPPPQDINVNFTSRITGDVPPPAHLIRMSGSLSLQSLITSWSLESGVLETLYSETEQRLMLSSRSKQPHTELTCHSKALHALFRAVANHPDHEEQSGDSTAGPPQDSQVLFTETDVTLPSCLDGSPGSQGTETDGESLGAQQLPDSCHSSSLVLAKVYEEMMTIYEQLKAERQSQQQWELELQARERRLKQQEEAVGRLAGLDEMIHIHIAAVEEKQQQEVKQLQDLLRERSKENRRLKSSFDSIKELNNNMKKQLNEINEQNKKLESQFKRVQARLENLQRKYELSVAQRGCQKMNTECMKPPKKEKSATSGKLSNKGCSSLKLLALLLDWVVDGQTLSSVKLNEEKVVPQCLPPEIVLNERCLQVLPLLADQLHHTPLSEADLLLNLLRLIHWALRHMDSSPQHVVLSATMRRIGEEVSKPPAEADLKSCSAAGGPCRTRPLYRSPCPHTSILSTLITLRTVTQADVLAQALDSLHTELMCEESRGLFIRYRGVSVLLSMLQAGHGGLHTPVDILVQLTEPSRYLNPFLEACSCEAFFRTASQLLKNPRAELPTLEKISILLQKLSNIRKNRRLFELSSLHLQIQELYHRAKRNNTFLCLNLSSILHNLK